MSLGTAWDMSAVKHYSVTFITSALISLTSQPALRMLLHLPWHHQLLSTLFNPLLKMETDPGGFYDLIKITSELEPQLA